jgi:hypothetical protein
MRAGEVELVTPDGQVLASGKVGEWMQVQASGVALTACADLGDELLLVPLGPAGARVLQFGPPDLSGWCPLDPPQ